MESVCETVIDSEESGVGRKVVGRSAVLESLEVAEC